MEWSQGNFTSHHVSWLHCHASQFLKISHRNATFSTNMEISQLDNILYAYGLLQLFWCMSTHSNEVFFEPIFRFRVLDNAGWPGGFVACPLPTWPQLTHRLNPIYYSVPIYWFIHVYRQTYNMSRTKSQNLNVSSCGLQLVLPNPLKPGVNSLRPSDAYMRQWNYHHWFR